MASSSLWNRFQRHFLRYDDLGFSIDISRMKFPDDFFTGTGQKIDKAFAAMRDLEAGGIANPDEKRMVGHYWLRKPALAPNAELRTEIENTNARIKKFAADVHGGKIKNERGEKFQHVLSIGIGGSALGPEFVADALGTPRDPMDVYFFDNTDPDGFDRVFKIGRNQGNAQRDARSGGAVQSSRPGFFQTRSRDYRSRKRSRQARGEKRLAGAFSNVGLGRRSDIGNERGWARAHGAARIRDRQFPSWRRCDG
jgi:hypothetical protein